MNDPPLIVIRDAKLYRWYGQSWHDLLYNAFIEYNHGITAVSETEGLFYSISWGCEFECDFDAVWKGFYKPKAIGGDDDAALKKARLRDLMKPISLDDKEEAKKRKKLRYCVELFIEDLDLSIDEKIPDKKSALELLKDRREVVVKEFGERDTKDNPNPETLLIGQPPPQQDTEEAEGGLDTEQEQEQEAEQEQEELHEKLDLTK